MRFLRRWLKVDRPDSVAIIPSRALDLHMPYDETYRCCVDAIERVLGGVVREADPRSGSIEASFGLTFSERISCSLSPSGDGTRVRIESRRGVRATPSRSSPYIDALAQELLATEPLSE